MKTKSTSSFLEVGSYFLTKPIEIANHFNNFFIDNVKKLRNNMTNIDHDISYLLIKMKIMKNNKLKF